MIDETKIVVLESVSLRAGIISPSATNNSVVDDVSVRIAQIGNTEVDNKELEYASMAIAGFRHNGGNWEEPKDMSYVTIHD